MRRAFSVYLSVLLLTAELSSMAWASSIAPQLQMPPDLTAVITVGAEHAVTQIERGEAIAPFGLTWSSFGGAKVIEVPEDTESDDRNLLVSEVSHLANKAPNQAVAVVDQVQGQHPITGKPAKALRIAFDRQSCTSFYVVLWYDIKFGRVQFSAIASDPREETMYAQCQRQSD